MRYEFVVSESIGVIHDKITDEIFYGGKHVCDLLNTYETILFSIKEIISKDVMENIPADERRGFLRYEK